MHARLEVTTICLRKKCRELLLSRNYIGRLDREKSIVSSLPPIIQKFLSYVLLSCVTPINITERGAQFL